MKSAFGEWFEAQHGKRLDGSALKYTDDELRAMIRLGEVAARSLEARKLWDEKRTSALYAWQARERMT
jgi:hypothetical protein